MEESSQTHRVKNFSDNFRKMLIWRRLKSKSNEICSMSGCNWFQKLIHKLEYESRPILDETQKRS